MKDYKVYIDLDTTQGLLEKLIALNCETFTIEGGLNDTHVIETKYLQDSHKLGRVKFRKYMILGYEFANEWSNRLYMHLTDNDKLYEELYNMSEKQLQEFDEWYSE